MAKLDSNVRQANADFQSIKNKIVENGIAVAEGTKTSEYAGKVDEVYAAGKKSQYDEFWDSIQDYGNRTNYNFALCADMWDEESFKPKYPIIATNLLNTFAYWGYYPAHAPTRRIDLRTACVLDTSQARLISNCFFGNRIITAVGVIDTRATTGSSDSTSIFREAVRLETIEKLILKSDGSQSLNAMFDSCSALINLTIEGTIGQNGLNLQWSTKLSHDSLMSTINALKDYSADTSGTSWVVTLGSENLAKLTAEEILIAEQKGWDLV